MNESRLLGAGRCVTYDARVSIVFWLLLVLAALATGLLAGRSLVRSRNEHGRSTAELLALTGVLDTIPDAAAVIDAEGRAVAVSASCVTWGLISDGQLRPRELRDMNVLAQRTGEAQTSEVSLVRPSGSVESRLHVSPMGRGFALIVAQDVSEARRLDAVRRDFVANVSHELKTPVGALGLLAEAVLAADGDAEQIKRFAGRMQFEVRRLADMVTDLVELSRVESGVQVARFSAVEVDAIVAAAVSQTMLAAQEKTINVVATSGEGYFVYGDEDQLITALRNLISNAIRYSPSHTRVGIGVRRVGEMIEIAVTDQGPGIAEADQERIFERFYRADPARSRETGGTGLGLAIVKHVCATHGGECTVWSRPGQGSTFALRIPAHAGSAEPRGGVV